MPRSTTACSHASSLAAPWGSGCSSAGGHAGSAARTAAARPPAHAACPPHSTATMCWSHSDSAHCSSAARVAGTRGRGREGPAGCVGRVGVGGWVAPWPGAHRPPAAAAGQQGSRRPGLQRTWRQLLMLRRGRRSPRRRCGRLHRCRCRWCARSVCAAGRRIRARAIRGCRARARCAAAPAPAAAAAAAPPAHHHERREAQGQGAQVRQRLLAPPPHPLPVVGV